MRRWQIASVIASGGDLAEVSWRLHGTLGTSVEILRRTTVSSWCNHLGTLEYAISTENRGFEWASEAAKVVADAMKICLATKLMHSDDVFPLLDVVVRRKWLTLNKQQSRECKCRCKCAILAWHADAIALGRGEAILFMVLDLLVFQDVIEREST